MTAEFSEMDRCAGCDQVLPTATHPIADERAPCPTCGSTARYISGRGAAAMSLTATAEATVIPYAELLLQEANDLYAQGKFGLAVVIAHTACEVVTENRVTRALRASSLPEEVKDLIRPRSGDSYNITARRVHPLFNALTGAAVQHQRFWAPLKQSWDSRNAMVHAGVVPSQVDAMRSLEVAREFVSFVLKL